MNLVIDTNVFVAGLRSGFGASNALLDRICQGRGLTMHLSTAAVLEYEEVLVRELVPAFYSTEEIQSFLDDVVATSVRHASIRRYRPISHDPDDDCMIELALTADVDALITHNTTHFRELAQRGIPVLTPKEFLRNFYP